VRHVSIVAPGLLCVVAGCQDSRVPALEQRVKQLEERIHQLEAERTKASEDEAARRAKLESCVADANAEFDASTSRYGTKLKNGNYDVPVPMVEQMQRQRQARIEQCRLLYSK
jgi:outer membrane murein-binding lipoprotein Lpp